jgi:hypothetical protein
MLYDVVIPPETQLLFKYLVQLREQLYKYGCRCTVDELYEDLPTRAYFMMRIFDELDFCTLYPANRE